MRQDNALEVALAAALTDPARQGGFETAFLAAELYVCPTGGAPAPHLIPGFDVPLRLDGIVLKGGQKATAVFSRPEFATPVFGEPASMIMRGRHLLEGFSDGYVVLNPGQAQGLVLSPDDMSAILVTAGDAQPFTDSADVVLANPDPEPNLLVARLKAALSVEPIKAAWLARSMNQATGVHGWRLEVRADADPVTVRQRVQAAVEGLDFGGESLDLLIAAPMGADGVGLKLI